MTIKILACFGFLQHYVISLGGGEGTHIFCCMGACRWTGYHFQDSESGTKYHYRKNRLHYRVHICLFWLRNLVVGHLHSTNMTSIAWMATFPNFLIDFSQISRAGHNFGWRNSRTGYFLRTFCSRTGSGSQNLTPGRGDFSNFPAPPPPRMFADQVPPQALYPLFRQESLRWDYKLNSQGYSMCLSSMRRQDFPRQVIPHPEESF